MKSETKTRTAPKRPPRNRGLRTAETSRDDDERLYTRREAAEFLRKSPRTIDYYVARARGLKRINKTHKGVKLKGPVIVRGAREKLPFIKIGGDVFFDIRDLRKFRDERKVLA